MNELIDVANSLYQNTAHEVQYVLFFADGRWKAEQITSNGTASSADLIDEYVLEAITSAKLHQAAEVFIVHNHPKGNPKPSFMDYYNYETLHAFFRLSGIPVADYLIVSPYGYYSFKESKQLDSSRTLFCSENATKLSFSVQTLDDVLDCKENLIDLLEQHQELLVTPTGTLAGSCLDIFEISENFGDVKGNHLFFSNSIDEGRLSRLTDVCKVLSPVEAFALENGEFVPMIANGLID